jgi:hypothetical protein
MCASAILIQTKKKQRTELYNLMNSGLSFGVRSDTSLIFEFGVTNAGSTSLLGKVNVSLDICAKKLLQDFWSSTPK